MCGYYGKQGYVAQFERDLDNRGLYEDFKKSYEQIAKKSWVDGREEIILEKGNIAKAYSKTFSFLHEHYSVFMEISNAELK